MKEISTLQEKSQRQQGKKIVAVVGAGHVQGILQEVSQEQNLQKLEELPPKKSRFSNG